MEVTPKLQRTPQRVRNNKKYFNKFLAFCKRFAFIQSRPKEDFAKTYFISVQLKLFYLRFDFLWYIWFIFFKEKYQMKYTH